MVSEMPTPRQLAEVIDKMPDEVEYCVQTPSGKRIDELWIGFLGVWLRLSDYSYSGDRARGRVYPGFFGRWILRSAVARWEKAHG